MLILQSGDGLLNVHTLGHRTHLLPRMSDAGAACGSEDGRQNWPLSHVSKGLEKLIKGSYHTACTHEEEEVRGAEL